MAKVPSNFPTPPALTQGHAPGRAVEYIAAAMDMSTLRHIASETRSAASERVHRFVGARGAGHKGDLARLRRYGLMTVGQVVYPPFDPDASNLSVQLVSSRYEHSSLILKGTSYGRRNRGVYTLPSIRTEGPADWKTTNRPRPPRPRLDVNSP
jgi:hypothetical protein